MCLLELFIRIYGKSFDFTGVLDFLFSECSILMKITSFSATLMSSFAFRYYNTAFIEISFI